MWKNHPTHGIAPTPTPVGLSDAPQGEDRATNPTLKKRRREWKRKFLRALAETGNVTAACKVAVINAKHVYRVRQLQPKFRAAWDRAVEEAVDGLEKEAWERATTGRDKPVYHNGQIVGYERRYSDTLLIFLLKGRRPEVFGDRQKLEHSGTTACIEVKVGSGGLVPHGLSPNDIEEARKLLEQMSVPTPVIRGCLEENRERKGTG